MKTQTRIIDTQFGIGKGAGRSAGTRLYRRMFDGLVYLIDTKAGTAKVVFDCETIVPRFEVPVRGGMTQLLATPQSGDHFFGSF